MCRKFILFILLLMFAPRLQAQNENAWWAQIRKADSRIAAIQARWLRNYIQQSNKALDVDKELARLAKEGREKGQNEKEIQESLRIQRHMLTSLRKGSEMTDELSIVRRDDVALCEIRGGENVPLDAPRGRLMAVPTSLDYWDGKQKIALSASRSAPSGDVYSASAQMWAACSWVGQIKRSHYPLGTYVGEGAKILAGMPLFADHTPANSSLKRGPGETVILEKRIQWPPQVGNLPMREWWLISTKHWRPLRFERRFDLPKNKYPMKRWNFLDYRRYAGDIWLPHHVRDESYNGIALSLKKTPSLANDYKLQLVKLNRDAETSALQQPLPKNTNINDARFALRPSVHYVMGKGIPGDNFVLNLVTRQEWEQALPGRAAFAAVCIFAIAAALARWNRRAI